MMTFPRVLSAAVLCALFVVTPRLLHAQDFRGRINGTVTDNTGAVLPGVTVTVASPALSQPQVQVSGAERTPSGRGITKMTPLLSMKD